MDTETRLLQVTVNEAEAKMICGSLLAAVAYRDGTQEPDFNERLRLATEVSRAMAGAAVGSGLTREQALALVRRFLHLAPEAIQGAWDIIMQDDRIWWET
jgi:hypothetical protein